MTATRPKRKPATNNKGDEEGDEDVEEEPAPKSKARKTAVRGRAKPVDNGLDEAAIPGASTSEYKSIFECHVWY